MEMLRTLLFCYDFCSRNFGHIISALLTRELHGKQEPGCYSFCSIGGLYPRRFGAKIACFL